MEFPAPVIAMPKAASGRSLQRCLYMRYGDRTKDTCLAITPAKIGVPYNTSGILQFIDIIGAHTAKEMFFTAEPIPAEKAYVLGILNHIVPAGELEAFTRRSRTR